MRIKQDLIAKHEKATEFLSDWIPSDITYTLRGISQVIIVNNQLSGLFVLAALYVGGGALLGTLSLVSTFVATFLARRIFIDVDSVKNGLAGYNACLIGCAFPVFVQQEWGATSFFAGVFCAVVASFMNLALKPFGIPTFTFAFNFTIIPYVMFAFDSPGPLPDLMPTAWNIVLSPFKGVSQIWVVNSALSGLLIILGVLVDSWGIALYALFGAIVGCTTGYVFGGEEALVKTLNGLYGFNSCLMACAIGVFYVPSIVCVCFGIVACIFTELLTLGLGTAFDKSIGIPSFTLPFCIVATISHLILRDGAVKGLVGALSPTSPESNFFQHKDRLEKEKIAVQTKNLDPTMHVFYGPSAVSIVPNRENYIDRRPRVDLSETHTLDETFKSHRGLHQRPSALSSSLLSKYDMDDDDVHEEVIRKSSIVKVGLGSSLLASVRTGLASSNSSSVRGGLTASIPKTPLTIIKEPGESQDIESAPIFNNGADSTEVKNTSL